jgi:hypothetical protein
MELYSKPDMSGLAAISGYFWQSTGILATERTNSTNNDEMLDEVILKVHFRFELGIGIFL